MTVEETMKGGENGIHLITVGRGAPRTTPSAATEVVECCCMCGDPGLSYELVPCVSCDFRFQHRYCSNRYPDATSYDTCNWCLSIQEKDNSPKGKHGTMPSQGLLNSPQKRKSGKRLDGHAKKRNTSRMFVTDGKSEEEEKPAMPNKGITRYRLRNRSVRRYKLLDEVAT